MDSIPSRRDVLRQFGAGVIGSAIAPAALKAATAATQPVGTIKDLPTRRLGRIGIQVPVLSLGTGSLGHGFFEPQPFEEVVNAAIGAGIRYIDTAPIYDVAQERLAPVMARRRRGVFLVTKSHEDTSAKVLADIERSLKHLQIDHVDLCHVHNCGEFTYEQVAGKGGQLEGLEEAKRRGWIRYIGISGHLRPDRFVPVIETGRVDLIMVAMNFVDHHTYAFHEKVLPAARKQDCAIVCMKVYGGAKGGFGAPYRNRAPGLLVSDEDRQNAVDYALTLRGVATMNIGLKTLEELRQSIQAVRNHRPLEGARREAVLAKGARLAKEWGPHFGPVA